jgi:biopolymer transport protein ExbD
MPIRIQCDQCNAKLSVATRKAGLTIRCPGCKSEIFVPVPEDESLASPIPVSPWDDEDDEEEDEYSFRSAESEFDEMDLTPMVDVTFLLLIFFMITASFTIQKTLQFPPPEPKEEGATQTVTNIEDLKEDSVMVEIDEKDGVLVEDKAVSDRAGLADAIQKAMVAGSDPKTEILITRHYFATHEITVAVVDAAKEVGIQKIRMATLPGSAPDK